MSNIQEQLSKLEDEVKALKTIYAKNATNLPTFEKYLRFSTSENKCTQEERGNSYSYSGNERVIVEFRTVNGLNTIADLEFDWSQGGDTTMPKCHRIPFNGGVAWEVSAQANRDSNYNWVTTTYDFNVNSVVDGTLTARMVWQ